MAVAAGELDQHVAGGLDAGVEPQRRALRHQRQRGEGALVIRLDAAQPLARPDRQRVGAPERVAVARVLVRLRIAAVGEGDLIGAQRDQVGAAEHAAGVPRFRAGVEHGAAGHLVPDDAVGAGVQHQLGGVVVMVVERREHQVLVHRAGVDGLGVGVPVVGRAPLAGRPDQHLRPRPAAEVIGLRPADAAPAVEPVAARVPDVPLQALVVVHDVGGVAVVDHQRSRQRRPGDAVRRDGAPHAREVAEVVSQWKEGLGPLAHEALGHGDAAGRAAEAVFGGDAEERAGPRRRADELRG